MQLEMEIWEDANYKSILKAEVCPINPIPSDRIVKQLTGFHMISVLQIDHGYKY